MAFTLLKETNCTGYNLSQPSICLLKPMMDMKMYQFGYNLRIDADPIVKKIIAENVASLQASSGYPDISWYDAASEGLTREDLTNLGYQPISLFTSPLKGKIPIAEKYVPLYFDYICDPDFIFFLFVMLIVFVFLKFVVVNVIYKVYNE